MAVRNLKLPRRRSIAAQQQAGAGRPRLYLVALLRIVGIPAQVDGIEYVEYLQPQLYPLPVRKSELVERIHIKGCRPGQAVAVARLARRAVAVAHIGIAKRAAVAVEIRRAVQQPVRNPVDGLPALQQPRHRQRKIFDGIVTHDAIDQVGAVVDRRTPLSLKIIGIHRPEVDILRIVFKVREGIHQPQGIVILTAVLLQGKIEGVVVGTTGRLGHHHITGHSPQGITAQQRIAAAAVCKNRHRPAQVGCRR